MCLISSRNCSPVASTWAHPLILVGSVLHIFLVFCGVFFFGFLFVMSLSNTLALTVHDAGYSGKGFVSHICLKFALDFRILQNFKHPSSSSSFIEID